MKKNDDLGIISVGSSVNLTGDVMGSLLVLILNITIILLMSVRGGMDGITKQNGLKNLS